MKQIKQILSIIIFISFITSPLFSEENNQNKSISFDNYQIKEIFKGKPASIDFSSDPDAKRFKTRLTTGIKEGANFAGHYSIILWGCGTNCQQIAIVNTKKGKICAWLDSCGDVQYKLNSYLLIVNPFEDENPYPEGCKTEYYLWVDEKLQEVNKNG